MCDFIIVTEKPYYQIRDYCNDGYETERTRYIHSGYYIGENKGLKKAVRINSIEKVSETSDGKAIIYAQGEDSYIRCEETFVEIMQELRIYG